MDYFIIKQDINDLAREGKVDELTSNNDKIWQRCLSSSIEETASYIRHYYNELKALASLLSFDNATTYAVDDWLTDQTNIYTCIQESTGNALTDTAYFELKDSRNAKLKDLVLDILLYNLHTRTSPHQLPENRMLRYDSAISYLKDIQRGRIQIDLPLKETSTDGNQENYPFSYGQASTIIDKHNSV